MPEPAAPSPDSGPPPAHDSNAARQFGRLVEIMRTLRSAHGCPWDREQTLESLRPFVLEETYEVLQAIDERNPDALRGEIGDLIFEGVFLAQICAEAGQFSVAESLEAINRKLIRRHPHVFGPGGTATGTAEGGDRIPTPDETAPAEAEPAADAQTRGQVRSAADVLVQWEALKDREQSETGAPRGVLSGVPRTLPSLLRAHEIGSRVAAVGFDWVRAEDVLDKIQEEIGELRQALQAEGAVRSEEEMGDLLFGIANLSRKLGIEPESALRRANQKFSDRFGRLEQRLRDEGTSVHDASLERMEDAWGRVKDEE